jgi:hypothetical protein
MSGRQAVDHEWDTLPIAQQIPDYGSGRLLAIGVIPGLEE